MTSVPSGSPQELEARVRQVIEDYRQKLEDRTDHHMGCVGMIYEAVLGCRRVHAIAGCCWVHCVELGSFMKGITRSWGGSSPGQHRSPCLST